MEIAALEANNADLRVGVTSQGLARIPNLNAFLGLPQAGVELVTGGDGRNFDLFVGWGNKESGRHARRMARRFEKPFILLEDGFLRSMAPKSVSGEPPLSLVLDDLGIYYDASEASRLETMVAASRHDASLADRARQVMNTLRDRKLSKYNNFDPDLADTLARSEPGDNVLVVDQTRGDNSVTGALASDLDFLDMLQAAFDENPGSNIWIKLHPEVVAGRKFGYLQDIGRRWKARFITSNVNPWDLFDHFARCYTVSSQLGFEALVAGREVRCFGLPFYAGWGLTSDQKTCARRNGFRPRLEELFAAAYLRYSRYVNPYTGSPATLDEIIELLSDWSRIYRSNQALGPFAYISPWKRKAVRRMFQKTGVGGIFFANGRRAARRAAWQGRPLTAWASKIGPDLEQACKRNGVPLYRLEDGFIRSVGLGTNFHPPMSLILDTRGIYYNSAEPSDLEIILNEHPFEPELLNRARRLIDLMVENNISKYNVRQQPIQLDLPTDRRIVFVPGQVETDASLLHGSSRLRGTKQLLKEIRRANPDAYIIYKPHPDVTSGQRPGLQRPQVVSRFADVYVEDACTLDLISKADEVHTLTSLTGFEALLRGKEVHCYGMPFYAGWGLTHDRETCPRRKRTLTLEQLVAGALILYPRYHDPKTNLPCGPEIVIQRIIEERADPTPVSTLIAARERFGLLRRAIIRGR